MFIQFSHGNYLPLNSRHPLPEDQISLNFDVMKVSYKNRICQRQCFCPQNKSGLTCDIVLLYLRNFRCLILGRNCSYLRSPQHFRIGNYSRIKIDQICELTISDLQFYPFSDISLEHRISFTWSNF